MTKTKSTRKNCKYTVLPDILKKDGTSYTLFYVNWGGYDNYVYIENRCHLYAFKHLQDSECMRKLVQLPARSLVTFTSRIMQDFVVTPAEQIV